MAVVSNFQDVVVLNSNTLTIGAEALIIGSDAGTKSLVFGFQATQASALFLAISNPIAQNTIVLPAANGTLAVVNAIELPGTTISNGAVSFANTSGLIWGANGSTITAALTRVSGFTLNDFAGTFAIGSQASVTLSSTLTSSGSTGNNSAIRMTMIAPMNVSYLDPGGQQELIISGVNNNGAGGSFSVTASMTWWAAIFTMSGSTASLVSSTSNSTAVSMATGSGSTISSSSSIPIDPRFTNLNWQFQLRDYLFLQGTTLAVSGSANLGAVAGNVGASIAQTAFGASRAQVSYSVPYFVDGQATTSAVSYLIGQINGSSGTNFNSLAPRIEMLGS